MAATVCSKCGTEYSSRRLSRGLCPTCLLSLGLSRLETERGGVETPESPRLMPGATVSHYQLLEKLGSGGMGEVFLARDTVLNRNVALKFLSPELRRHPAARQRFLREAKAAAALDHPYICRIYEIGEFEQEVFLSMEYVPGSNLKQILQTGPLSLADTLKAGRELAESLDAAFQQGIVHRDLKPSNIMFGPDGHVKVLDFGLAKRIASGETAGEDTWLSDLTETGSILGTPAYMSPEQLQGKDLDHRSDLFSLGVVLFEMATGTHPFLKESKLETINAIVSAPLPALSDHLGEAPPLLKKTLKKMLAKRPDRRFRSFREVGDELGRLQESLQQTGPRRVMREFLSPGVLLTAAAVLVLGILFAAFLSLDHSVRQETKRGRAELVKLPVSADPRLAVLPLVQEGPGEEDDILVEGLTDSLISRLTGVPGLAVISRPSVMYFKGKELDLPHIATTLQVAYTLSGSFQRSAKDVVLAVQLVRSADGKTIWAKEYRQNWNDILQIEADISQQVVNSLNLAGTSGQETPIQGAPVRSVDAYELYLHGRFYMAQRSARSLERAISFFRQAIELDPGSALAYSGLADAHALLGATGYGGRLPAEVMPAAEAAARKALALDPESAEAHTSLANTLMSYRWDWEESRQHFERAVALNPGYGTARHWYGLYLAARNDLDGALREIRVAQRLDPLSPAAVSALARCLYYRREYDEAILLYRRALELDQSFAPAHLGLALAYVKKHEGSKSRIEQTSLFMNTIAEFEQGAGVPINVLSFVNSLTASEPEKERWADRFPPFFFAMAYTILGYPEHALGWLERAFEERSEYLVFLQVDPIFDKLRPEARFQALVHKLGLDS